MRLKLLLHNDDRNSFSHDHIQCLLKKHFDLVLWQPTVKYNRDHVLVVDSFKLHRYPPNFWHQRYLDQGYKVIVDNLWEIPSFVAERFPDDVDQCHVMQNTNWFWYNESIMYTAQGLDSYVPNRTYEKLAFMPMRLDRGHRRELVVRLSSVLDQLVWSFNAHGRHLPGDLDPAHEKYQRHFNSDWYNQTHFSIVAESQVDNPEMFVTEKTFKPMAFYHPFVVMGQAGLLDYLHTQGFETFDNLFDESYDQIHNYLARVEAVINTIKNYNCKPYDKLTQQKIAHNHNRFFDQTIVHDRFVKEIVEPIIHYAESR
jgi:hypothetical protein